MSPETIRKDFKIFENRDIAYLDSGATSQSRKRSLIRKIGKIRGFVSSTAVRVGCD